MDDVIRPGATAFRDCYAQSYRVWQKLSRKAAASLEFPSDLVDLEQACPRHPYLHSSVKLEPGYNYHARGTSTWRASDGAILPLPVTAHRPISVSVEPSPERFPTWFAARESHPGVLTLAWAYYTDSCAVWKSPGATSVDQYIPGIPLDLGLVSNTAARWWAAILAPSQGWTSVIGHEDHGFWPAPWSTNIVQTSKPFLISRIGTTATLPNILSPPSFREAACFISAYSNHHGAENLSRAAFAAALMLPTVSRIKSTITAAPPWGHNLHQLGRLLTLSCNNFIQSLLRSVIFEPDIPCNICGAWTQGAFAVLALEPAKASLQLLAGTLMARNPKLGFLWLGAALLGIHDPVLRGMRAVFYPIDLTLARWTDTIMPFIQEPVASNLALANGATITRADKCRLTFLSQSVDHSIPHPPIAPFPPFGMTALEDCILEVRQHVSCCGSRHQLSYVSWTWDCPPSSPAEENLLLLHPPNELEDQEVEVDDSHMDRDKDTSEDATRCIFTWLDIREHEWIENLYDSDEESDSPEGDGRSTVAGRDVGGRKVIES
ncbi:hypothetical protein N658DRAFT_518441 [Parathielavia hyrcaniae]|uniref:Uncharacterized protein n=1 Tax=Parathielavia hyrcaniae TaxID=113614 RepID=A0AAN6PTL8_9PEZI|nr:hypothetical protein N658DRAFT_518441 [Parathielavia hyrcaniae]